MKIVIPGFSNFLILKDEGDDPVGVGAGKICLTKLFFILIIE